MCLVEVCEDFVSILEGCDTRAHGDHGTSAVGAGDDVVSGGEGVFALG